MAATAPIPAPADALKVPVWAWLIVAVAAFAAYLMTMDNTILGHSAEVVHEFFHDARHFIGAPCH